MQAISVGPDLPATFGELRAILRCKAEKRFGESVDVPNGNLLSHGLRELAVCGKQIADPQATDAVGFAHAFEDDKVGVACHVAFQSQLISLPGKINEGFVHNECAAMACELVRKTEEIVFGDNQRGGVVRCHYNGDVRFLSIGFKSKLVDIQLEGR